MNADIRQSTMRNHTATHLLQAGLREVLGKHVKQAGSLVAPNHLRFDFSHFTAVADEELQDIEDLINKEVLRNTKIEVIENVPIDVAINEYNAMALFGEKYGDKVRVIKIGDFSTELCGGTHTAATGEIGLIKILKEGSVSSGVRRIEAVTGEGSLHHFRKDHQLENVVASLDHCANADGSPAEALQAGRTRQERRRDQAAGPRTRSGADEVGIVSTCQSVTDKIKDVRGIKVLAHRVDNLERAQMRTWSTNCATRSARAWWCWARPPTAMSHSSWASPKTLPAGCRQERSSLRLRKKSAARAVAVPIWPRPAAKIPPRWMTH